MPNPPVSSDTHVGELCTAQLPHSPSPAAPSAQPSARERCEELVRAQGAGLLPGEVLHLSGEWAELSAFQSQRFSLQGFKTALPREQVSPPREAGEYIPVPYVG